MTDQTRQLEAEAFASHFDGVMRTPREGWARTLGGLAGEMIVRAQVREEGGKRGWKSECAKLRAAAEILDALSFEVDENLNILLVVPDAPEELDLASEAVAEQEAAVELDLTNEAGAEQEATVESIIAESVPNDLIIVEPASGVTWEQVDEWSSSEARGFFSISPSGLAAHSECSLKWLFGRHGSEHFEPEVPAWWNIGGTSVHKAAELIARAVRAGDTLERRLACLPEGGEIQQRFEDAFNREVAYVGAKALTPRESWRSAKRGVEGEAFWRASGPKMLERYVNFARGMIGNGYTVCAIEEDVRGSQSSHAILDQAWQHQGLNEVLIIDLKTGAAMPNGRQVQLQRQVCVEADRFKAPAGAYAMLRDDGPLGVKLLRSDGDTRGVVRARDAMFRMIENEIYPANTSGCWGCRFKEGCPAR